MATIVLEPATPADLETVFAVMRALLESSTPPIPVGPGPDPHLE